MAGMIPMVIAAILLSRAIRRNRDSGRNPWPTNFPGSMTRRLTTILGLVALAYSTLAAGLSLVCLYGLCATTFGSDRSEPALFLMFPLFVSVAAALAWLGLRLLRDKGLPRRVVRTWSAAVAAWFDPNADAAKPKSDRADRDFD